jgi:hypothetical protein
MVPDRATRGRTGDTMMTGEMSRRSTNHGPLHASLCLSFTDPDNKRRRDQAHHKKRFHRPPPVQLTNLKPTGQ